MTKAASSTRSKKRVPSNVGFEEVPILNIEAPPQPFSDVARSFNFLSNLKFEKSEVNYGSTLIYEPYPMCCGAAILYNFYASSPQAYEKLIAPSIARAVVEKKGMLMGIINETQAQSGAKKALEKFGFTCVFAASNPNHNDNTTIYMYIKNLGMKDIEIKKSVAS